MYMDHEDIVRLFKAILLLEDLDECDRFFVDLCTVNEVKTMAQRLEVARMLDEGHTYTQIEEKTGASTATISRVKRYLEYGNKGYRTILDRMKK